MSIDFAKIREQNRLKANQPLQTKIKEKEPDWLDRINHLINHHLSELNSWEEEFVYNQKTYLIQCRSDAECKNRKVDFERVLSQRVKTRIEEIEKVLCTSICHALNKAKISHS